MNIKCTKFDFGWGSDPDPAVRAYSAPPDPLAGFKRPISLPNCLLLTHVALCQRVRGVIARTRYINVLTYLLTSVVLYVVQILVLIGLYFLKCTKFDQLIFRKIITGRMLRSGKLPVLFLLTGQKSGFSPRRGTDSGQTLQYRRAPGSAWLCKISRQSVQTGGNAAPKISKISTFW